MLQKMMIHTNNDYTNDYVIVESDSSLSWAEIE